MTPPPGRKDSRLPMATEETNLPPTTPSTPTSSSYKELVDALEKTDSLEEFLRLVYESGLPGKLNLVTPDGESRTIWERKPAEPPEPDK